MGRHVAGGYEARRNSGGTAARGGSFLIRQAQHRLRNRVGRRLQLRAVTPHILVIWRRKAPFMGPRVLDRMATGVAGLDHILCGGLASNRMYLLDGSPGVGKTTL